MGDGESFSFLLEHCFLLLEIGDNFDIWELHPEFLDRVVPRVELCAGDVQLSEVRKFVCQPLAERVEEIHLLAFTHTVGALVHEAISLDPEIG